MIYPFADTLEEWGSKYGLVALAARRAKQIKAGSPILITTSSRNPLTIALEEIAAGRVTCTVADTDALIAVSQEPEVAQLLAIPERTDEDYEAAADIQEDVVIHPEGGEPAPVEDENKPPPSRKSIPRTSKTGSMPTTKTKK